MPVKINIKYQLLFLLAAFAVAAGIGFLLNFILEGPRLGAHYDFLLELKKPQAVSTEILIINTDDVIETNDKFLVLMALTEMGASNLIMTDKASVFSPPLSVNESVIRSRFLDEYVLLGANIRNLFEAIRSGSVSPAQAPSYVERLVELTEQGRDRLLTVLTDRDEDLLRAVAVFGRYMETQERPEYDKDGKLRRVRPYDQQNNIEHPVFTGLKHRYAETKIESNQYNNVLKLKKHSETGTEEEIDIILDNGGNIITPHNSRFRSVDISLFRDYDEAFRIMRDVLSYADGLGAFSQTLPEESPLFLGDYSVILREELLKNTGSENRASWLKSREDYFKSLEAFVSGPAESIVVKNYNDVIEEEGLDALKTMRDELIQAFVYIRAQYEILNSIRTNLVNEINASFCIMGTPPNTEYSALLANAVITGSHIKPIAEKQILFYSFSAAFIAITSVFWLRPLAQVLSGLFLCVISLTVFSIIFIYYSSWLDPLIAFGAGFSGTITVFFCKCAFAARRIRRFRSSFGSAVPPSVLKELAKEGKPHPQDVIETNAAVVAIKDINLLIREDREKTKDAGAQKKMFYKSVKESVFKAGGIIAGFEGDTIIACFGSPLDKTRDSLMKAHFLVKELLANEKTTWRFGIDSGLCAFYWSEETGFSVYGSPAVRARILASRTARLKVRALITDSARDKLNLQANQIDSLFENTCPIFELNV